ncbi:MAG: hypothetical protein IT529_05115 [Burkholderiales bacterium]|nr:hypothetical protein [Burkholderiales bacterium]
MALDPGPSTWLAEHEVLEALTLADLVSLTGLSEPYLRELVDYGTLTPLDPQAPQWAFAATCLATVRAAGRLHASFELEPCALALVLSLIGRIDALEAELAEARARLPRY